MRHCYVVRVFTIGLSGGNALGVIPDATGLSATDMQQVAADLGFSESVFIDWPGGGPPSLRIFTPAAELPFAGHPLVGTAWVLNRLGPGVDRMTIAIGEVGIRMENESVFVAPPPIDQPVRELDRAAVDRLGLDATRAWLVEVPSEFFVVEMASEEAVVRVPAGLPAATDVDGLYVFSGRHDVRSRFFAPHLGVAEDPATGSAAVALCAVRRSLGEQSGSLQILQGRPEWLSEIHLAWDGLAVELGGTVLQDELRLLDEAYPFVD